MNNLLDRLKENSEKAHQAYQESMDRRKRLKDKRIESDTRILAWVDILGFSQELVDAKTEEEFRDTYLKMLSVHEFFDKAEASDTPEEIGELNRNYGREIIALSDGLVISLKNDCVASSRYSPYDFLMGFISDLIMAQARCALNGIFLRGGISIGHYHYDNDILLSPALIKAYRLETKWAVNPVIIVEPELVSELQALSGRERYAEDSLPSKDYFREYESEYKKEMRKFFYLDYLSFVKDPGSHGFHTEEDRKRFSDKDSNTPEDRDKIYVSSHMKSAAQAMGNHKAAVQAAYDRCSTDSAREKFRWLARYHNESISRFPREFNESRFSEEELKGIGTNNYR